MIKKISAFLILLIGLNTSCQYRNSSNNTGDSAYEDQKAEVTEVIQTTSYSYLKVIKKNQKQWIAIIKQDIQKGDIIYFRDGMEMKNFESPELNRTFESVFFVQEISDQPIEHDMTDGMHGEMPGTMHGNQPKKPVFSKLDIHIEQPTGGTTIGDLYTHRESYEGKSVTVRGQVTKVNTGIMGRNWVHIQDGTGDGENYDLTLTTAEIAELGEVVTFSGVLSLNKDFGSGYFYALILENSEAIKVH